VESKKSKEKCKWFDSKRCKDENFLCEKCDFLSLPFEKDAITKRVDEELEVVMKLVEVNDIGSIQDKLVGIVIMRTALKEEFRVVYKMPLKLKVQMMRSGSMRKAMKALTAGGGSPR
jgi:hypothetical protein